MTNMTLYDPTNGNCEIKVTYMTVSNPAENFRKKKSS